MRAATACLCVSVAIAMCPIAAQAQSASKVLNRYIDAIGGRKAIEKIVSTEMSGTVTAENGETGAFTQRTARPDLYSVSLSSGGSRWSTGFNGRSVWQDDSVDGVRTLYGAAASRVRVEARDASTHLLVSEKINQVSDAGRDQVRGHQVIGVVIVPSNGATRTLYFDAGSYLLVKDVQQADGGVEERFFDDYRRVDGVLEPHRIEWHRNGGTFRIAVEHVVYNAPLDAHLFDTPAPVAGPALDIDATLSAAGRNEENVEGALATYAYVETQTPGRVDQQGRVSPTQGPTFEIFQVGGRAVARLLMKPGGQALSDDERRQEEERVKNVVRDYEQQGPSARVALPSRQRPGLRTLSGAFQAPLLLFRWFPVFPRMSEFSNIRRERVRGRPSLVMDFQPKRGVEPNDELARQVSKMAGSVWIDEASMTFIRIESHFRDDYERTVEGSSIWSERILINDEVWLPSRVEMNNRFLFAFGQRAQFASVIQFADYKKFRVETVLKVAPNDR
jgi:hypothetical protein